MWTAGCLAAAGGLLAGFVAAQARGHRPLLDPRVLRIRVIRRGLTVVFVFNAAAPSFTLLLMHYRQTGGGLRPVAAAVVSAPLAATAILGARLAPRFARRYQSGAMGRAALSLAVVMGTLALVVTTAASLWTRLPILAVGGGMFGIFTALVFGIILASVPESAAGSVSGLLPTAQQLSGTVGITLAGLCSFAVPALTATAFAHTLIYETATFFAAAFLALAIRTPPESPPDPPHPSEAHVAPPRHLGSRCGDDGAGEHDGRPAGVGGVVACHDGEQAGAEPRQAKGVRTNRRTRLAR